MKHIPPGLATICGQSIVLYKEEEAASERKFLRLQPQRIKAEEEQT
jgi:hypothetical protein